MTMHHTLLRGTQVLRPVCGLVAVDPGISRGPDELVHARYERRLDGARLVLWLFPGWSSQRRAPNQRFFRPPLKEAARIAAHKSTSQLDTPQK